MTSDTYSNWGSLILRGAVNPTGKEIGRGGYGRVFEVNYEGTLCAAKEILAVVLQYSIGGDLQKIKDNFLTECQIWSSLRHPSVVQFLGLIACSYIECLLISDCNVIRSVLSRVPSHNESVQITYYGNGEDAA